MISHTDQAIKILAIGLVLTIANTLTIANVNALRTIANTFMNVKALLVILLSLDRISYRIYLLTDLRAGPSHSVNSRHRNICRAMTADGFSFTQTSLLRPSNSAHGLSPINSNNIFGVLTRKHGLLVGNNLSCSG